MLINNASRCEMHPNEGVYLAEGCASAEPGATSRAEGLNTK